MNKDYKAYIFDYDGTIMESMEASILLYKHGFEAIGVPFKDEDAAVYIHETLHRTFERLGLGLDDYLKFIKSFEDIKDTEEVLNGNHPFEDAKELLEYLRYKNKKITILTGNHSEYIQKVLNHVGLKNDYEIVVGFNDVTKTKPDPEGLYLILDKLNLKKEEVCYIGDSLNDMLAAKNAGIDGILIDRQMYYPDSPDYFHISSLLELI